LLEALEELPIRGESDASLVPTARVMQGVDSTLVRTEISSPEHRVKDIALENTHTDDGSKVYAYLSYEEEGREPRSFAISSTYVIVGRVDPKRGLKPEIDLTSIDPGMTVSRQHARIRYEKTFFSIEDLKSRNKTRIREMILTPLKAELLRDGDVLQFGSVRVTFRVSDPG
jgi:hypothetical protein